MRQWTGVLIVALALGVSVGARGQQRPPVPRLHPAVPLVPSVAPSPAGGDWVSVRGPQGGIATFQVIGLPSSPDPATDPRRWAALATALSAHAHDDPSDPPFVVVRTMTADPAAPTGVSVSAPRRIAIGSLLPRILAVSPSFGPSGTAVTLTTQNVGPHIDEILVRFVGHDRPIVAHRLDDDRFTTVARASFMPGPVAVETEHGEVLADAEDVDTWFLRTHLPVAPRVDETTPLPGSATVRDVLVDRDDVRRFAFAAVEGTVLSAHAFAVDPWSGRLADPATDRRLPRFRLNLVRWADDRTIRASTVDGPGDNPWLHLRVPRTGAYYLELTLTEDAPPGRYLLDIDLERGPSVGEAPVVVQVTPQVGRPGDLIEVTGAFFSPDARILVAGVPTPARFISSTRLQARIPWGALPGPVQVQSRWGLSDYEPDDNARYVAVLPSDAIHVSPGSLVSVGTVVTDRLPPNGRTMFDVDLDGNQAVALAAWSVDTWGERLKGGMRRGGPDLALSVEGPSGTNLFFSDDDGGPGRNPAIGVSRTFPWRVPAAGRYRVTVEDRSGEGGAFIFALMDPENPGGSVPMLTVPLAIRVFVDPITGVPAISQEALKAQLDRLEAWNQAGIWPHAVAIEYIKAAPDHFVVDDDRELETVLDLYGAGTAAQDVIIVGGLPRGPAGGATLGLTWTPSGQVLLNGPELPRPGSSELPLTLAHELGHVLGRLHDLGVTDRDNLMHENLATQTGDRLGLDQVNHVRYLPSELRPTGTRVLQQPIPVTPSLR